MPNQKNSRDWDTLLAAGVPWQESYVLLAQDVREMLSKFEDGQVCSTKALQLALYPLAFNEFARQRFYRALKALSTRDLADCCYKSQTHVMRYGHKAYPLKWCRPDPTKAIVATPAAFRSPEHAIVQRLAALDPDGLELDPGQMDELHKILADARKLANVA